MPGSVPGKRARARAAIPRRPASAETPSPDRTESGVGEARPRQFADEKHHEVDETVDVRPRESPERVARREVDPADQAVATRRGGHDRQSDESRKAEARYHVCQRREDRAPRRTEMRLFECHQCFCGRRAVEGRTNVGTRFPPPPPRPQKRTLPPARSRADSVISPLPPVTFPLVEAICDSSSAVRRSGRLKKPVVAGLPPNVSCAPPRGSASGRLWRLLSDGRAAPPTTARQCRTIGARTTGARGDIGTSRGARNEGAAAAGGARRAPSKVRCVAKKNLHPVGALAIVDPQQAAWQPSDPHGSFFVAAANGAASLQRPLRAAIPPGFGIDEATGPPAPTTADGSLPRGGACSAVPRTDSTMAFALSNV